MSRCDYCSCRNGWECDDEYYRVSDRNFCDNFKLDFDTLSDEQKRIIQENLMERTCYDYDW